MNLQEYIVSEKFKELISSNRYNMLLKMIGATKPKGHTGTVSNSSIQNLNIDLWVKEMHVNVGHKMVKGIRADLNVIEGFYLNLAKESDFPVIDGDDSTLMCFASWAVFQGKELFDLVLEKGLDGFSEYVNEYNLDTADITCDSLMYSFTTYLTNHTDYTEKTVLTTVNTVLPVNTESTCACGHKH